MYYHREKRLVFLAHPRTASVSTARALQAIGFEKLGGDHHMRLWTEGRKRPAHLPDPKPWGETLVNRENRDTWTVFTTVRNHFDTAVSWIFLKARGNPIEWSVETFQRALDYNHWVEPNRMFGLHLDDADIVLRYECLESQLRILLGAHGLELGPLPRMNTSQARAGRPYRAFYRAPTREYIEERFSQEMSELRYAF